MRNRLATLVLTGAMLAAAAIATPVAAVDLTLRYCWGGDAEMAAMESVIKAWNDANPDIQVKGIGGSINAEEIVASVAGGTAPDMIIMCDNGAVAGYAHDQVIIPLDDVLKQIGADTSNIIPAALKWVSYQGKLYGLPFGQDTYALYYNTDAFKEVGLDPAKPPTTLDELWADAEKLSKWNADGTLARAGFIPTDPSNNIEQTSALFGCQLYDDASKKVTVNSQACIDWLNWYKQWYDTYNKNGALVNLIASRTGGDPGLLISGQQAMGIYGEWNTGKAYIPTNGPDLKYDTAPIPSLNPDTYGAGFINGNAFLVTAGAKDPAAAAKFGMYLMTDAPSKTMALQNASVPQLKSLLTDAALTSIPHFQAFLNIANHPKAWTTPMISAYGEMRDGLASALDGVLTAGADPKQALDELAANIQAKLDANGP